MITMERYLQSYGEWQDFKRQQPFAWTRFFNNVTSTVFRRDGSRDHSVVFITLHEAVHLNINSLSPIQLQKYTEDMERKLDLFVRWLQHGQRLRGWRGQAPGKENEPPNTQGGMLEAANRQSGELASLQTRNEYGVLEADYRNLRRLFQQANHRAYNQWLNQDPSRRQLSGYQFNGPLGWFYTEIEAQELISRLRDAIGRLQRLQAAGWPSVTDNPQEGGRISHRRRSYCL